MLISVSLPSSIEVETIATIIYLVIWVVKTAKKKFCVISILAPNLFKSGIYLKQQPFLFMQISYCALQLIGAFVGGQVLFLKIFIN